MESPRSTEPPAGAPVVPFAGLPAGSDARLTWAAAKVNLHLEVTGKRPDGFHQVETLILSVDLFDTLELRPAPAGVIDLTCDPPGLPTGPGNLVYKAAAALQRAAGTDRGVAVRLTKRIPSEAGLGGGSSDAAATLAALNRLWGLDLPREQLLKVAAEVGSDVGFFLSPPAGWCTGRGELVESEPVGGRLDLVIVKPPVGLGTAEVYKRVTVPSSPVSGDRVRRALRSGDVEEIAGSLHNRLQEPAFALRPEVADVHRRLAGCGPLGCLLSGSGSSVFALCRNRADAALVADRFRESARSGEQVFIVRSYWPRPH